MKKLPYIEDYISLMADHFLSWPIREPIIKLARYDEPIVNSMSDQIQANTGLTDKQSQLAYKIVTKYKKQWASAGYDVSHLAENPQYRLPIRVIDRSKLIRLQNNIITISFPYDQELISYIRAGVSQVPGSLYFDKEQRHWRAGLTEQRLIWTKEFGLKFGFEFNEDFDHAIKRLLAQPEYSICLVKKSDEYIITNAAESLLNYVTEHVGVKDIVRLYDYSSILGYSIDKNIKQEFLVNYDARLINLLTNKEINLTYANRSNFEIESVITYAKLVNRLPIYVYEVNDKIIYNSLLNHFDQSEICILKSNSKIDTTAPVIYCTQWKLANVNIPLLITMHTLMIGYKRQQMLQNAEKVVYYTQQVE